MLSEVKWYFASSAHRQSNLPVVTCRSVSSDVLATVGVAVVAVAEAFDGRIAVAYSHHVDDSSYLFF